VLDRESPESVDWKLVEIHSLALFSVTVSRVIAGFGDGEDRSFFGEGVGRLRGVVNKTTEEGPGGEGRGSCSVFCNEMVISDSSGCFDKKLCVAIPRCIEFGTGLGGGVGGHSVRGGVAIAIPSDVCSVETADSDSSGGAGCLRSGIIFMSNPGIRGCDRRGRGSSLCIRIKIAETTSPENGRPVLSLPHILQKRFSSRRPLSTTSLFIE